jgi:hypothetical protein
LAGVAGKRIGARPPVDVLDLLIVSSATPPTFTVTLLPRSASPLPKSSCPGGRQCRHRLGRQRVGPGPALEIVAVAAGEHVGRPSPEAHRRRPAEDVLDLVDRIFRSPATFTVTLLDPFSVTATEVVLSR